MSLKHFITFNFGMEIMLGLFFRVGGSVQPFLSPNHSLCRSGSLVTRLLAAVQGVSKIYKQCISILQLSKCKPKTLEGELYSFDFLISITSCVDSDKNIFLAQIIQPWGHISKYLQFKHWMMIICLKDKKIWTFDTIMKVWMELILDNDQVIINIANEDL